MRRATLARPRSPTLLPPAPASATPCSPPADTRRTAPMAWMFVGAVMHDRPPSHAPLPPAPPLAARQASSPQHQRLFAPSIAHTTVADVSSDASELTPVT